MGRARKANIHAQALADFDDAWAVAVEQRRMCLEDRQFCFVPGAQWAGKMGEQFANRPMLEVNKVQMAVNRIISAYRNNRITVSFVAKDGGVDDDLADVCAGLYRSDEQDSSALEAYDNAFEEAVAGGFGGYRFCAVYEDEGDPENEQQRIRIEPIFDADQVLFFDPSARRKDKGDARWAFLLTPMAREAFKEEYGEEGSDFAQTIETQFVWNQAKPDVVYVAEYYVKEDASQTYRQFETLGGETLRHTEEYLDEHPEILDEYAAVGTVEVAPRKVKRDRVHKYIIAGHKVIEDCGYIAGEHIPLVPVYGKRVFVGGVERCMGHVRLARDSQVLANMQRSKLAELAASSAIEKPIFMPEQVAGHEHQWARDAVENYPFALINPVSDSSGMPTPMGPVGYTKPPQVPPAMAALLQVTETDLQEVLGSQQQNDEVVSNTSGFAVELAQSQKDMQTFIYTSNMADAVRRGGEVWLSMAREVYVEAGRRMKTIGDRAEVSSIELGAPVLGEDGAVKRRGALADARFDVTVDVGPSSASRKAATVRGLLGMLGITQDPEAQAVIGAAAMMNMEGEGIGSVREHFRRKLVAMGVETPTEEDRKKQADQGPPQPDANALYLQSAAKEAEAKAQKAQADTEYALARTQATKAETIATLAELDLKARQQVLDAAGQLDAAMRERQPAPPQVGEMRPMQ